MSVYHILCPTLKPEGARLKYTSHSSNTNLYMGYRKTILSHLLWYMSVLISISLNLNKSMGGQFFSDHISGKCYRTLVLQRLLRLYSKVLNYRLCLTIGYPTTSLLLARRTIVSPRQSFLPKSWLLWLREFHKTYVVATV